MKLIIKQFRRRAHHAKGAIFFKLQQKNLAKTTLLPLPYFCQWESAKLAAAFLKDPAKTSGDPLWRNSGAATPAEYTRWSWSMCGMTCLKMILTSLGMQPPGIVTLGKTAAKYGAYKVVDDQVEGMFYKPFVVFVKQAYGLQARIKKHLTIKEILLALNRNDFVITSVSPAIRDPKAWPAVTGGHLVLMTGYELEKQVLYFHNPSGNSAKNQANATITLNDFAKFFSGRGIIIKNTKL